MGSHGRNSCERAETAPRFQPLLISVERTLTAKNAKNAKGARTTSAPFPHIFVFSAFFAVISLPLTAPAPA